MPNLAFKIFGFWGLFLIWAIAETPPKNATVSTAAFSPVFKYHFSLNLYYNIMSFLVFIKISELSFASCPPSLHVSHITHINTTHYYINTLSSYSYFTPTQRRENTKESRVGERTKVREFLTTYQPARKPN